MKPEKSIKKHEKSWENKNVVPVNRTTLPGSHLGPLLEAWNGPRWALAMADPLGRPDSWSADSSKTISSELLPPLPPACARGFEQILVVHMLANMSIYVNMCIKHIYIYIHTNMSIYILNLDCSIRSHPIFTAICAQFLSARTGN